jgi:UDP-glucose 4-epimerase
VINVAGGRQTSLLELFELIRELTDSELRPIHDPPHAGDVRHSRADLGRARELLGFVPQVELREGLARTIESLAGPSPGETRR